jgi:citrate synthase
MIEQQYVTAEEAATILDISRATLYAYVSRGLIRSQPIGDGSRRHRYAAADVEALRQRREQQRNPSSAVERALNWGAPLLESSITLIDGGRFYYRGQDATALALEASLEEVAGLIWTGELDAAPFSHVVQRLPERWGAGEGLDPSTRFQTMLPLAAADNAAAYDLRPEGIMASGARIMYLFARLLSGVWPGGGDIAGALGAGWDLQPDARRLLNAALVLCADHELNVSAFTARCIASAAATPYAVVQGGLAALEGTRHGGTTERVEALLLEAGRPEEAGDVLAARLRRGDSLPGFDHPLYPEGDPRARLLLDLVEDCCPESAAWELAVAVAGAAEELLGLRPTLDFGLVTAARALDLPPGSPLAIFALGRTAGWIGHALEQYVADTLIRPRARYVGEWPQAVQ